MTKMSTPGQSVNIIQMINKCDSFLIIEKLINWNRSYNYTQTIYQIVMKTAYAFAKFIYQQELKEETMDERIYQEINLKFFNVVKKCIKQLEKEDIGNYDVKIYLDSIIKINE